MRLRRSARASVLFAAVLFTAPFALAQSSTVVPNPMQGFSTNRDKPIRIKAQSFELRDKEHKATFVGNVQVVQGDTVIRCKSLIVTYLPDSPAGAPTPAAASPGPGSNTKISRIDASGGVIVTQNDQTATGETGIFDVLANTVTLMGNVVVSQNGNVMRGEQLVVDLNTGVSRVMSKSRGPVEMLIPQSPANSQKPGGLPAPKLDALRPAQRN